ncbi:MAG: YbjN domain-containing protein [Pararhodobacter sp.]
MPLSEQDLYTDDGHPIDMVETLAEHHAWEFDRVGDDQIAMAVEGQWRSYSLTLAWAPADETLRLLCTYEMEPPAARMAQLYEVMNLANDLGWTGGFTYWQQQGLMVWRYGLLLSGGQLAAPEQIDQMIHAAVAACERFYPAFQLVAWADRAPDEALKLAITQAYGRA